MPEIAEVVLGVDLGSEYTTVGVRGTFAPLSTGGMIRFGRFGESGGMLLRSRLSGVSIGAEFVSPYAGAIEISGIKSGLATCVGMASRIDRSRLVRADDWRNAVGFIALVLRHSINQVLRIRPEEVRGQALMWRVVIGVPDDVSYRPGTRTTYDDVVRCAWQLALTPGPIKVPPEGISTVPQDPDLVVEIRSETEALVDGWLSATPDAEGPHVLIDIGATSTQLLWFTVSSSSPRTYAPTARHGIPLGTLAGVDAGRLGQLRRVLAAWLPSAGGWSLDTLGSPVLLTGGGAHDSAVAGVVAELAPGAKPLGRPGTIAHRLRLAHGLTFPTLRLTTQQRRAKLLPPSQLETRRAADDEASERGSDATAEARTSGDGAISQARAVLVSTLTARARGLQRERSSGAAATPKTAPNPGTDTPETPPTSAAEVRARQWGSLATELLDRIRRGPSPVKARQPTPSAKPATAATRSVGEERRRRTGPPKPNPDLVPEVLRRGQNPVRSKPARARTEAAPQPAAARAKAGPQPGDTQYPSADKGARTVDVIIGLDFGTSSTKVVIQTPTIGGQRAVPVPLQSEAGSAWGRYLLPTRIRVGADGLFEVGGLSGADVHGDLKVALIDICTAKACTVADTYRRHRMALAAGYLGVVLRDARQRYLQDEVDTLSNRRLRWQLNLGIPSAGYGDTLMREVFRSIASASWRLSTTCGPIRLADAEATLDIAPSEDITIEIVPEVAAQVVGYAQSPSRRDGLHLLVDVGASTLDVCAFNLHERDHADHYALLMADVQRLGTYELHRRRLEALGRGTTWRPELAQLAPDARLRLPATNGQTRPRLDTADEGYVRAARIVVMQILMSLRKSRYPGAPNWSVGLPVFLCGGGSLDPTVSKFMGLCSDALTKSTRARPLEIKRLPIPHNFDASALSGADQNGENILSLFHRSSVAFGLSYDALNIGEITPPSEVDPIHPIAPRRFDHLYVGKDQV